MTSFLEKLERWVSMLDEQLNDTTVQMITGRVFTHDPCAKVTGHQEEILTQDMESTLLPPRSVQDARKTETGLYPTVMKKAPVTK